MVMIYLGGGLHEPDHQQLQLNRGCDHGGLATGRSLCPVLHQIPDPEGRKQMDLLHFFLETGFWVAIVRMATPLIFGTLGELVCERAGVLNLGIEGIMAVGGAFLTLFAFDAVQMRGSSSRPTGHPLPALSGPALSFLHCRPPDI